jgi:hypothetical protein
MRPLVFFEEHREEQRRSGELDSAVEPWYHWIACSCGAEIVNLTLLAVPPYHPWAMVEQTSRNET